MSNAQPNQVCVICGREPATTVRVKRLVGMVVMHTIHTFKQPVCREHGEQAVKEFLVKTLIFGWWGVIAFFGNLLVVIPMNLIALSKIRKLGPPQGAAQAPGATAIGSPAADLS
jgi:hypothetical protein